jgi:processive 1,2-diacylglycerol beta-glucosyltransferase
MGPKMLILSASAGAGHVRAAQAIELAAREVIPDVQISNIDVMTLTNAGFRRIYSKAYLNLVNSAPHVMGYVYDYFDRPRAEKDRKERLRRAFQKLNLRKLTRALTSEPWDIAVSTHFLPAEIIAMLRRSRKLSLKQVVVTTDFDTHRMWANDPAEAYTTATEEGKLYLCNAWGVDPARVHVTGIPIHPAFAKPRPRDTCAKQLNLQDDRPVILQLAGGFGVGPIADAYRALLSIRTPAQIVVVCGKNEKAKRDLASIPVPQQHSAQILGYTDEMDKWMACADIVVSKPGGLTTSELLARGNAMLIVNPTPGQESRNSDFVLENGAGLKVNSLATLAYKAELILSDPARLKKLQANSKSLGKPRAAYHVLQIIQQVLSSPPTPFTAATPTLDTPQTQSPSRPMETAAPKR